MPVKRLAERVSAPFAGAAVDRDKGVIRGVKLCGGSSANGRDYPPEVFRRDVRKYEGVAIYADHGRDRSVDRKLGWIERPHVDADGTPRGDAHLLKAHPLYERVMEAAERNPALFGFSHVALCETSYGADGRERVEGLRAIESVDLVAEPATTKGIFEARIARRGTVEEERENSWLATLSGTESRPALSNTRSAMPVTIRELAMWVTRHPCSTTRQILAAKRLAEMDAGAVGDEPVSDTMPPDEAGPDDAITGGFKAALMSVIEKALGGAMDPAAALKKIKTLLAAHCDATADDSGGDSDNTMNSGDDSSGSGGNRGATESRRFDARTRERPASAARHQFARFSEDTDLKNTIPKDGLAFARWVAE
jgi:hypothetical protein